MPTYNITFATASPANLVFSNPALHLQSLTSSTGNLAIFGRSFVKAFNTFINNSSSLVKFLGKELGSFTGNISSFRRFITTSLFSPALVRNISSFNLNRLLTLSTSAVCLSNFTKTIFKASLGAGNLFAEVISNSSLVRQTGKILGTSSFSYNSIGKGLSRLLSLYSLVSSANIIYKGNARVLAVSSDNIINLNKGISKFINSSTSNISSFIKSRFQNLFSIGLSNSSFGKAISKTILLYQNSIATINKLFPKTFSGGTLSTSSSFGLFISKSLILSSPGIISNIKQVGKNINVSSFVVSHELRKAELNNMILNLSVKLYYISNTINLVSKGLVKTLSSTVSSVLSLIRNWGN